jgi:competence protein ComEA
MAEDGVAAGRRITRIVGGEDVSAPLPAARTAVDRPVALAVAALAVLLVAVIGWLALRPAPSAQAVAPRPVSAPPLPVLSPAPSVPGSPVGPAGASGAAGMSVYVVGQVRRPGVVTVPVGARVVDAVTAAGGVTGRADLTAVNLARKVADGEQVVVPKPGQVVAAAPGPGAAGAGGAGAGPSTGAPVSLNTGTEADFDGLPGVGPVIAGRIVAWRTANGRFATVEDLAQVQGIGDATMARLRPLVTV